MILLDGEIVNVTLFPDKTSQVWKLNLPKTHFHDFKIVWNFEHEGELFHLLQLVALIKSEWQSSKRTITLHMNYLPYARQDKEISNEKTFSLRVFAEVINELEFDKVTAVDPHSAVASELIENFEAIYPIHEICAAYFKTDSEIMIFPDKGGREKYKEVLRGFHFPKSSAEKTRDQATGLITDYKVDSLPGETKTALIVDDICDGGMTFILLAKTLKDRGVQNVHLYVSHGIFSKGLDVLREAGISRIFTKEGEVK